MSSPLLTLFGRRGWRVTTPAVVTPTYGDELVTNGNMEAGDPPSSWTAVNYGVLSSVADERTGGSGTKSLNIATTAPSALHNGTAIQDITTVAGTFYLLTAYSKNVDATRLFLTLRKATGDAASWASNASTGYTATTWGQQYLVGIAPDTASRISLYTLENASEGGSGRFDDVSMKAFTVSSIFGDPRPVGPNGTFITRWPTQPTSGNRVGMVIALDSPTAPTTWIQASADGTNIYLSKYAPTYTSLISTAKSWVNGAEFKVIKRATSVEIWYNGAQVGTTQTISGISGAWCAWLSTDASLKPSTWRAYR